MNTRRRLSICGMIAPLLFIFTAVLGGTLRPGYSHLADTVSELFSPGSPNKLLLDTLHTIFALLLVCFGIGVLWFVREKGQHRRLGTTGATLFILMGLISLTTATLFPQDAWGSTPTVQGELHKNLSGVIGIVSILYMLLLGIWFRRVRIFPGFGIYSFITIGLVFVCAGFFIVNMGGPLMGLAERITILAGFLWTFTLALLIYSRNGLHAG